jgi:sarcosine oxidase
VSSYRRADVIVIGLGAMGSAACFQLATRGVSVIGIDQYEPPHAYGSTHGDTRMTRLAVGEGPEYVPLVRRSHELWREIEGLAGVPLLTQPGGLVLGDAANPFLSQTRALAREYDIAHETLSPAAVAERFPMFAVDETTDGYFELGSGYVRPERAVHAQLTLARRRGATVRLRERVERWTASATGVRVWSDAQVYEADQLVICAGPWINELFPEGRAVFAVHRQLLYWFPIREGYDQLRDMPVFVWEFGGERNGIEHLLGFYGFPAIDGRDGGVKVATEVYGQTTTPDGRQHPASRSESNEMYRQYIASRLPWLGPGPVRTVSCLYTSTHGSRFVIDRHPDHDAVLIVSPCSGHGFKHSPAIGEAIAQRVIDGVTEIDLAPFGLSRAVPRPN